VPAVPMSAMLVLGVAGVAWSHLSLLKQFRRLNLPPAYISRFNRARLVMYCGGLILGAPLIVDALQL